MADKQQQLISALETQNFKGNLDSNTFFVLQAQIQSGKQFDSDLLLAKAEEGHLTMVNAMECLLEEALRTGSAVDMDRKETTEVHTQRLVQRGDQLFLAENTKTLVLDEKTKLTPLGRVGEVDARTLARYGSEVKVLDEHTTVTVTQEARGSSKRGGFAAMHQVSSDGTGISETKAVLQHHGGAARQLLSSQDTSSRTQVVDVEEVTATTVAPPRRGQGRGRGRGQRQALPSPTVEEVVETKAAPKPASKANRKKAAPAKKASPNKKAAPKHTQTRAPCRYGSSCAKPGCPFDHPGTSETVVEEVKEASEDWRAGIQCRDDAACRNRDCTYSHSPHRPEVDSAGWRSTIPCRDGVDCKRSGCQFAHPTVPTEDFCLDDLDFHEVPAKLSGPNVVFGKREYRSEDYGARAMEHSNMCFYLSASSSPGDQAVAVSLKEYLAPLANHIARSFGVPGTFAALGAPADIEVVLAYVWLLGTPICIASAETGRAVFVRRVRQDPRAENGDTVYLRLAGEHYTRLRYP